MGEKDLFYDLLANPQLALGDLEAVGHSTENSRLFSKDFYKNNEKVRAEFTKDDGTFDEKAFDLQYAVAAHYWRGMTDDSYNKNLIKYTAFDKDNIFVDNKYRTLKDAPVISRAPNVTRDTWGLIEVGKKVESGKSIDEIALAEKILLNPVEVEKGAEPVWGDSPNEEWWKKPFSTRVLAKYDSAGYHTDAMTGEKVWHEKDELKINANGTHYYEALDGRSTYGRQVLNKFNTLTTDGSWWNQYDFLDSDDLNLKSVAGSVAKNLALVGSMFIPYVGWGIAAASVLQQMTGLAGTFGKMLTGSENSTLSEMEGFSKSWSRQGAKTQYAQQNMMCWENFIDLIGDTTAQLREQRAIFKFVPALFKGKYGAMGKKGLELFEEEKMNKFREDFYNRDVKDLITNMYKSGNSREYIEKTLTSGEFLGLMKKATQKELEDYLTSYNKIGEKVARAYMVGITVGDAYGEAKEAGATDAEAALLTAGYAAMENALLSTELGRWIFPELKGERLKYKSIAKAFASLPEDVRKVSVNLRKLNNELKKDWMKRIFNAGKEAAKKDYSLLNKTAGAVLSSGLSEGLEEVSEEALADFSKACFNTYRELTGQEAALNTWGHNWDWNEAAKRYGMSFAGGIIGGGINAVGTDFDQIKSYGSMTREQAMEHLTWMARNNELGNFWDTVSKMELGNSKLGTKLNADGTWEVGTKADNLDLEVKKLLRSTVSQIQNIINVEGANLDDSSFIGNLLKVNPTLEKYDLLGQLRTEAIANSSAAGKLMKHYNTLIKDIVKEQQAIDAIHSSLPDSGKITEEQQQLIDMHVGKLKELRKQKDAIMNGELTNDLIRRSLFEATYQLSEGFTHGTEYQFVASRLAKLGKKIEDLSEEEKQKWHNKYVEYAKGEKADDIETFADWYWDIAKDTSSGLQKSMEYFEQLTLGLLPKILTLQNLSSKALVDVLNILNNEGEVSDVQDYLKKLTSNYTGEHSNSKELAENAYDLDLTDITSEIFLEYKLLQSQLDLADNETIKQGILDKITELETKYPNLPMFILHELKISKVLKSLGSIDKLFEKLTEISLDPSKQLPSERNKAIRSAVLDTVGKDLLDSVEEIKKVGFVHPEVRNLLLNSINDFRTTIQKYAPEEDLNDYGLKTFEDDPFELEYNDLTDTISKAEATLIEMPSTPIQQILNTYVTSLATNETVEQIIKKAVKAQDEHKTDLENVTLSGEAEIFDYNLALKILELARQGIIGARTDNADLGNLFGYNKTINDLYKNEPGFVELATLSKETAEYALLDIDMAIDRVQTMKSFHEINSGNKLNSQNQASVNKSLIMYNRVNRLITSIRDDDDKEDIRTDWKEGLDDLQRVLESLDVHRKAWGDEGDSIEKRNLNISVDLRVLLEKEGLILENALYDFFNKNIDNVKDPKKLARILDTFNYINKNSGILNKNSLDIDDNAFTWWLASKAALRASDFNAVFTRTIDGEDVENPIAPISTLELGIYAGVAAIFNGDMFKHFANAMSHSISEKWKNMSYDERKNAEFSGKLMYKNERGAWNGPLDLIYKGETIPSGINVKPEDLPDKEMINSSDIIPNYVNTLFIEGIAGSGKSTGVFRSIMKILFSEDPEVQEKVNLSKYPIFFAHGTKQNADDAVASFNAPDNWAFLTFDKKSLFSFFTDDYRDVVNENGEHLYVINEDLVLENGNYKSAWKIKNFIGLEDKLPKVMFIDEWSLYTQPEVAFLQQLSNKFGIQIIAGGDLDQNTPRAALFSKESGELKKIADVTIDRNSFPRMQKLGVSMRTGNAIKTENQNKMRAWDETKNGTVELLHIEIDGQLYGDKVYNADNKLHARELKSIEEDIQKMVNSLKDDEKIGYIYHSEDSDLYKLISSKFKDKFNFYSELDAQGREARFYVVENDRSLTHFVKNEGEKDSTVNNNSEDYYRSLYTGITRASLATIVVAPQTALGEDGNKIKVGNAAVLPTLMVPDGYTAKGIKKYTLVRKDTAEKAWKALGLSEKMEDVHLTYIARTTAEEVILPKADDSSEGKTADALDPGKPTTKPPESKPAADESIDPSAEGTPAEIEGTESGEDPVTEEPSEPVILPRGTEVYDFRPGMGGRFLGAIVSYDSDSGNYTLTLDGKDDNYTVSYEEMEKGLKNGFQTMDPEIAKNKGLVGLLSLDEKLPYTALYNVGTEIYDADSNLIGTIQGFDGDNYTITAPNNSTISIPRLDLEKPNATYLVGKTTSAKYKVGQVVGSPIIRYTIKKVNKLASGGFSYDVEKTIKDTIADGTEVTFEESAIDDLLNNQGFKLDPEVTDFAIEETLGIETETGEIYELAIEEILDKNESIEEEVKLKKDNISFTMLGHTFNTFYTGLNFEAAKRGEEPIPSENDPSRDRIDMGIGLYKIDPKLCRNEQLVATILGNIRSAAMFVDDNNTLINQIKKLIPALKNDTLEIKYAWISKSRERSAKYALKSGRFIPPLDAKLRNMPEGDESLEAKLEPPLRTLSLVIRRKNKGSKDLGESILEIPMITFTSPQTILYKIGQGSNGENPVYKKYIEVATLTKGDVYQAITAVKDYIDSHTNLGNGYKALSALCKLWLYNNDGIRFIGGTKEATFNFAKKFKNLGVKYVKNRTVEKPFENNAAAKNNYVGKWHSLAIEEKSRPEVTYSNIMMSTNKNFSASGTKVTIAAAGHPFVLRWEGTSDIYGELTDEVMLKLYIKLLVDPTEPKYVKLEYVSPPEATIEEYLNSILLKEGNPYGNSFTAYHILSALYANALGTDNDVFWGTGGYLDTFKDGEKSKKDLAEIIRGLDLIVADNPKEAGENHSAYLTRITLLLKQYMDNHPGAITMMNNALFKITYPNIVGENTGTAYRGNIDKIAEICKAAGITGVLRRKELQHGLRIAGYALLLKTDPTNRFCSPEGKAWRIFSKFDSPTFDITMLLPQDSRVESSIFGKWAGLVKYGARGRNPKPNAKSVWYFNGGYVNEQINYYNAGGNNAVTSKKSEVDKWREDHTEFLGKLGINADTLFAKPASTVEEFLQQVAEFWTSQKDADGIGLGHMATVFPGNVIFCGNMDEAGSKPEDLPEVYKHLRLTSILKSDAEANMYLLNMVDDRDGTNYQVKLEIFPDAKTYNIFYMKEMPKISTTMGMTSEDIQNASQAVSSWLESKINKTPAIMKVAEKALKVYQECLENTNAMGPMLSEYDIAKLLAEEFEDDEDDLADMSFIITRGKSYSYFEELEDLKPEETEKSEEDNEEVNWCPVLFGTKKFM